MINSLGMHRAVCKLNIVYSVLFYQSKSRPMKFIFLLVIFVALSAPLQAADITVLGTLTSSVNIAIDSAAAGDRIIMPLNVTCDVSVSLYKSVIIAGGGGTVDCTGYIAFVTAAGCDGASIESLIIRNSVTALRHEVTGNVSLIGVYITASTGRGIIATGSGTIVFVTGSEITYNMGGAMIITSSATVELYNTAVSYNKAAQGAALYISSATGTVNGTYMIGNAATSQGGAVYSSSSPLSITGTVISFNNGTAGAAVYSLGSVAVHVSGCTLQNNTVSNIYSYGAIEGGSNAIMNITTTDIYFNSAIGIVVPTGAVFAVSSCNMSYNYHGLSSV